MTEKEAHKSPDTTKHGMDGAVEDILKALLYHRKVFVVGVGGCGCNVVEYITKQNMDNVKTIGINTDKGVLGGLDVDRQMLIGKGLTYGMGALGNPTIGKRAAELSEEQILKAIEKADIVLIAAGLGGGTGSGASNVVADMAKRNGKLVVSYAVMPFSAESDRTEIARDHLKELSRHSNATIVFENDNLTESYGEKTISEAMELPGRLLHQVVKRLKLDYVSEFMLQCGVDIENEVETISEIKKEAEERIEIVEPPVLQAMECNQEEMSSITTPSLDFFLETYTR